MACESISVTLMSGRAVQVPASMDDSLGDVRLEAQRALQSGMGVLRDSKGELLDDQQTVGDWVAVKELNASYYIGETLLFTIYTHYGNLI